MKREPVDDIDRQIEAVEPVHHGHVERRRRRAFLDIAAHVDVVVVGPPEVSR